MGVSFSYYIAVRIMRKTIFIKNAAIMTATGTILRLAGIFFKVWLASSIGSEGIGLYQVIFSVYALFSALFVSGTPIAVTRLCATEFIVGNNDGLLKILRRAIAFSLLLAFISFIFLLFGYEFIAEKILCDHRAGISICIFAFSLPFLAVSGVIKGYFAARRKAKENSFAVLIEQAARIAFCIILVKKFAVFGIAGAVAGVLAGDTIAEVISCIYICIAYKYDSKRLRFSSNSSSFSGMSEFIRITTPITASRYSTSLLRTAENILMPKCLLKSGGDYSIALSVFGAVKGMALPLLFFPSSILNAFSSLLIPEMSDALALKKPYIIKSSTQKVLTTTWLIGVIFGCYFFLCGEKLGSFIYSNADAGYLIKILAPLVPLMYCDSISDGILKGLDRQKHTFITATADSALRILLIFFFVPIYSINGFIVIMYISNLFTFILNAGKLLLITGIKPRLFSDIILPFLTAFALCTVANSVFSFINSDILYLGLMLIFSCGGYFAIFFRRIINLYR